MKSAASADGPGISGLLRRLEPEVATRREQLIAEAGHGAKLVGYFCNYVPRELISAAGAIPLRLTDGGSYDAKCRGERYVRADACPFCKSTLGLFATDPLYRSLSAVVVATLCDQMRRLPEVIHRHFGIPVMQLALPRTRSDRSARELFRQEVNWLCQGLEKLTGTSVTAENLETQVKLEAEKRSLMNCINDLRRAEVPSVSETAILRLVTAANLLPAQKFNRLLRTPRRTSLSPGGEPLASRPTLRAPRPTSPARLLLAGSIIAEQDTNLVQLVEQRAAIVTDLLCNGVRSFYGFPHQEPQQSDGSDKSDRPGRILARLADFYFDQPGCINRRPNTGYYELARRLRDEFQVQAVVFKTLLYCDAHSFEARRLEVELGLPLLHIDTDYGEANREQMQTRVEAFLETLAGR